MENYHAIEDKRYDEHDHPELKNASDSEIHEHNLGFDEEDSRPKSKSIDSVIQYSF